MSKDDDFMNQVKDLKTTDTDMMFQYFADDNKLIDDIKHPEKHTESDVRSPDKDKYTRSDNKSEKTKTFDKKDDYKRDYYKNSEATEQVVIETEKTTFASKKEEYEAKMDILKKLVELVKVHKIQLSQNYNITSDYDTMKQEHDYHKSIRDRYNGINYLMYLLKGLCWGIEVANDSFNPFDFKLEGWSDNVSSNEEDFRETLGELYDKYFKSGKAYPPEIKLIFLLAMSAFQFHGANYFFANKFKGLGETFQNNPGLSEKLKNVNEQHIKASAELDEFNKHKQAEYEYMTMQRKLNQHEQTIQSLQNQLLQQRSDTFSNHNQDQYKTQKTMSAPIIPESIRRKQLDQLEQQRQQQIIQQKKELLQKASVSVNPDLDSIITTQFNDNKSNYDDKSIASNDTTDTKKTKKTRTTKAKKSKINVST